MTTSDKELIEKMDYIPPIKTKVIQSESTKPQTNNTGGWGLWVYVYTAMFAFFQMRNAGGISGLFEEEAIHPGSLAGTVLGVLLVGVIISKFGMWANPPK